MTTVPCVNDGLRTPLGRLCALLFLSGASGLMYETVWLRVLTRVLGNTVYAASTVLAVFMAGLALGSFVVGRWIDRTRRPLRCYALLELAGGLAALTSLALPDYLLPLYRVAYEWSNSSRPWLTASQMAVSLALLLPPTAAMGATLPTLCAAGLRRRGGGDPPVGALYAANTLGAVAGTLASGFVLIGAVGETKTILLGAALSGITGGAAFVWSSGKRQLESSAVEGGVGMADCGRGKVEVEQSLVRTRRAILVAFAVSGFAALAGEVVWGRLLLLYQGTSVYAFSSMLAVVLTGVGAGSLTGGRWAAGRGDPHGALAYAQIGIGLAGLAALHFFDLGGLGKPDLTSGSHLGVMLLAPAAFLGPSAFLSGLSFPLGVRCCAPTGDRLGTHVAALYGWNTVGAIAGALGAGFVAVPLLGAGIAGAVLASLSICLGLWLLAVHPSGWRPNILPATGLAAAAAALLALIDNPYQRLLRGQMAKLHPGPPTVYHHAEEAAGTTTAFAFPGVGRQGKHLWVGGEGMTMLISETKLMAHLPIWLAGDRGDVLVVCFGMGTTVRAAAKHDGVRVTAVELVPGVVDCFRFFHEDGPELLRQRGVRIVVDDGRNYLLMHPRQYDVITIDPAPPVYSAGAVNLYSRDFLTLCRQRIRPGGVICLWVPPANESEVKAILRTFVDSFEHVTVWGAPNPDPEDRGFYLIGSRQPMPDAGALVRRGFADPRVAADLAEWDTDCDAPQKVLDLYVADGDHLGGFLAGSPVITDDEPFTEFPLLRSLYGAESYRRRLGASQLKRALQAATTLSKP